MSPELRHREWQLQHGLDDSLFGLDGFLAGDQDVGQVVVMRAEWHALVAVRIAYLARQFVAQRGNDPFAIDDRQQADHADTQHKRLDNPPARDACGHQRRHLVVALQPGDREHGGDQRGNSAHQVKEPGHAGAVVCCQQHQDAALLIGGVDKLVQVAHEVAYGIDARQRQKAHQKDLDEHGKDVAIDQTHAIPFPAYIYPGE